MSTLQINETFLSIQGESTRAGHRCIFVRLRGCHLRCIYCDTEYAFFEGTRRTTNEVVEEVNALSRTSAGEHGTACKLVEITGGEPLLQPEVHHLMSRLCDQGYTVLLETAGANDIGACDPRVVRIMDLKTPSSGEVERNLWTNIDLLRAQDEIKFVLMGREDYDWMKDVITKNDLVSRVKAVLVSAVNEVPPGKVLPGCEGLSRRELAEWILEDGLDVIMQVQLHKLIWDPMARGV